MEKKKRVSLIIVSAMLLLMSPTGYGQNIAEMTALHHTADQNAAADNGIIEIFPEIVPLSPPVTVFSIPVPAAAGISTAKNYLAEIDVSNANDGYVMVRYLRKTDRQLRVIVKGPGGTPYIYRLNPDGKYEVFPLSEGNGFYRITVYEHVIGNKYSTVIEASVKVQLSDEFAPFIRPNQYVNYNSNSKTTKQAAELTKDSKNTVDKIAAIYNYIIHNISYDQQLAATIQPGYLPNVDTVLKNKKGICFDYAAVMAAMLRSQGIPAKLVVGYRETAYHAWISVYSSDAGWIDGTIYLDGTHWQRMDPTFASYPGSGVTMLKYIGAGNRYSSKYFY